MVFTGSFLGGEAMPSEENKKYGFVKKFRSILKSKFWEETSPEQYRIAEFILYSARFKREEIELRNGEKIIIEPGQLLTTISYIQNGVDKKGKWATEKTVKYALDKLQKLGFLSKKNIKSVPKFWYEYDIKGAPVSQKRGSSSNKLGLQLVKKGASHCTLVTVENWAFYQGEFENGAPVSQSKGSSITKEGLQLEQKGAITKECIYKNDIYNMSDSKESDHSPGAFKSDNNNSNKTNENTITTKSKGEKEKEKNSAKKKEKEQQIKEVVEYLNLKANRNYRPGTTKTKSLISARLKDYTVEDLKAVIDFKVGEWLENEKMNKYLRPETLFNETKFENYINELPSQATKKSSQSYLEDNDVELSLDDIIKINLGKTNKE